MPATKTQISRLAPIFSFFTIAVCYMWLVTSGTWNMIGSEWLGDSFDSLGQHLLKGESNVDPDTIKWEGLKRDSKVYMYFGPFPAFVRLLLNLIGPEFYGQWSRVSCLIAALLAGLAWSRMLSLALSENPHVSPRQGAIVHAVLLLGFSLGTPILYLISCARIYHEAILWGLCGGMWGLYAVVYVALRPSRREVGLWIFACAYFVTLLSRLTFALPMTFMVPVLFLYGISLRQSFISSVVPALLRRAVILLPIITAVIFQLWYNYDRFGSIFTLFDYTRFYLNPAKFGGEFNPVRIPSTALNYFGIAGRYLVDYPTLIGTLTAEYYRPELFMQGWREQVISLSVASPWILLLALVGFVWMASGRMLLLLACAACLGVQVFLILSHYFVSQRYVAELIPFLALGAIVGVRRSRWSLLPVLAVVLVLALSIFVTIASTLDWNMVYNGDASIEYKRKLRGIFFTPPELPAYARPENLVHVSDVSSLSEQSSFSPVRLNTSHSGKPLEAFGVIYPKGLGMHATSTITYQVPSDVSSFVGLIGLASETVSCDKASLQFEIRNERGEMLFQSNIFRNRTIPQMIEVDLRGAQTVSLSVLDGGDGIDCDHGSWYTAAFVRARSS